jgi:L-amino acid N-acyltransferase YncA
MIRDAEPMADAERIAEIYNHYVLHDTATFEVDDVGGAAMANRIAKVQAAGLPWLVATDALGIVGFAYASPFHERAAYVHTLSVSIYLAPAERGRGLGGELYRALLKRAQAVSEPPHAPTRSLIALIALPNDASVALHETLGFTKVGVITDAGRKFARWIDVGYWQMSCPIPDED